MKSTIAMAILVAMLVSLAACDIQRGSERATQGKSGDEGGSQESGRSQTKREQPKKRETLKGEVAKKPSQEQQQKKPEPKPEPKPTPRCGGLAKSKRLTVSIRLKSTHQTLTACAS